MGHRLTAEQEAQLLRQATREAHEAIKDLRAAIREATALVPALVSEFETVHHREMAQLSNHIAEESNRHAAALNADIEHARAMIWNQVMSGELVLSADKREVRLILGATRFDANQPLPYPEINKKEGHQ